MAATQSSAQAQRLGQEQQPFRFCLNTGTIRGQKLGIVRAAEIAAEAGFQAIEPWIEELSGYQSDGGSLADLRKRIADAGLAVAGAIGFAKWAVEDAAEREKALEQAKHDMDLVAAVGGTHIAAPPAGVTDVHIDPMRLAERYAKLLDVGQNAGVVPILELWGFSKTLSRVGEVALVAAESGREHACMLLDSYHIYKGGSPFESLAMLNGSAMPVFHINDWPAIQPDAITDADRVWPGDGVAPLGMILSLLRDIGCRAWLSLELFNKEYYKLDALEAAKRGFEKTKAVVQAALR